MSSHPSALKSLTRITVLMGAIAFLAMAPASTQAASVTQTWNAPGGVAQQTDFHFDHQFDQFDPSLGALESIEILLYGEIHTTVYLKNNKNLNTAAVTITGNPGAGFVLDYLSNLLTLDVGTTVTASLVGQGEFTSGLLSSDDATSNTLIGGQMAPFIGNGTVLFDLQAFDSSFTSGPSNVSGEYATAGLWEVLLTYNYTPAAPVPEPSSFALVGLGCIALGFYRRFARRRNAA